MISLYCVHVINFINTNTVSTVIVISKGNAVNHAVYTEQESDLEFLSPREREVHNVTINLTLIVIFIKN